MKWEKKRGRFSLSPFGIKCHTVNVKGDEERWSWQQHGSVITLPPQSLSPFFCSSLSLLRSKTCSRFLLLPFLKLLYACFLTATNILPRGQDLPLNMHARAHACMCTHIPTLLLHIHPRHFSHTYTRTHSPIAYVRSFQRDNWSEQEEREDLSMCQCPNYPISPLRIQRDEPMSRRKCTEGSGHKRLHRWNGHPL